MNELILVVDDNLETLEVLTRNLLTEGYTVFTAQSVSAAKAILKNKSISLIITDIKMPESNGMALIYFASENFSDLKVLIISGYPLPANFALYARKTNLDFLSKPFTAEELFMAVEKVLKGQSKQITVE